MLVGAFQWLKIGEIIADATLSCLAIFILKMTVYIVPPVNIIKQFSPPPPPPQSKRAKRLTTRRGVRQGGSSQKENSII